ncbi:MAG: molybdopterin-dependent oxidoreductase, partial [Gaiellales bacterium]
GWLCDRGRYALGHLAAADRVTQSLIRGGRGLESVSTAEGLDHVADRLRATVERFGPGSVAVLASGEQTNEEAHAWARVLDEALGGGAGVCGAEGGPWWAQLEPHAAAIEDLAGAATIVVAGDADLSHRAPVLELWIRKGVRNGARVVTVGPGATRLDTLRGAAHISAAPGTSHTVLLEAATGDGDLAGHLGEPGMIVIWSGAMRAEVASVLTHVAHTAGCTVLRTPRAANEIGCTAAGLGTLTPDQALERAERGDIKAMVLLGADPVGDWHSGERWRTALSRCFFALQVTAFQNDSTGWVTTIVPATATLEKDGTVTNLEGRVQRVRAAATPPHGVSDGYAWVAELANRLAVDLPYDPPSAFADLAARRPAFAGMSWSEIGEQARLGERPPAAAATPVPQLKPVADMPETVVVGYRELMSGPAVDHTPQLQFQRRRGIEIADADAERLGLAAGDRVEVTVDGHTHTGPALVQRKLRPGVVRLPVRIPHVGPGSLRAAPAEAADA